MPSTLVMPPEARTAPKALPAVGGLLLLGWLLFFHHLDRRDLWSSHEARAGQDARSILETGDWLMPRLLDGRAELQKPPLYYWLTAAAALLRGGTVDAWAVRLPAAAAAVLGAVLTGLFLGRRGRPVAGLVAGLALATMLHYTWMGRVGRIDVPLTCAVAVLLGGVYLGHQAAQAGGRARGWFLLAALAAAAAALLKGPIGLALAALTLAAWTLLELRLAGRATGFMPALRTLRAGWWSVPLALALAAPWFVAADRATHGEFFREFFLRHNLQRGLGGDAELDGHDHPFYFYAGHFWADLAPWSLVAPLAVIYLTRRGRWRDDPEARFGGTWFLVMFVFLSAMRYKRPDYLLPAYPGLALLLGCAAERWYRAAGEAARRRAVRALAGAAAACAVLWVAYVDAALPRREPARELRTFAALVREKAPAPAIVLGFRVDSHQLAFHLGRPYERLWEWENLDVWACQPVALYVVMPEAEAARWERYLEAGDLYRVADTGPGHEQRLVLLCTRPAAR